MKCSCNHTFAPTPENYQAAQVFADCYLVGFNCECGSTCSIVLWQSFEASRDLTGLRQGKLQVLGPSTVPDRWECLCDCGTRWSVRRSAIVSAKQAGCAACARAAQRIHCEGPRGALTAEYRCWSGILERCLNPNARFYSDYGGRGITVCERWSSSYLNFLSDMGRKPSAELTIERVDNEKGYEPGNCAWATREAQRRNRRDVTLYPFRGQELLLCEIAKLCGIGAGTLAFRLRSGWDLERATSTSARPVAQNNTFTLAGETLSVAEWAARLGVTVNQLRLRIRKGWSAERALTTPFNRAKSHRKDESESEQPRAAE